MLNWFQRTLQDMKKVSFMLEGKEVKYLERLQNAINFYRSREDNGEDTYIETDIPSITRLFIVQGIEEALEYGLSSFSKVFFQHLETRAALKSRPNAVVYSFLQPSEIKAINDLTAMINEYLEEEHLNHDQKFYRMCPNDLICFFIQNGASHFHNIPIPKASHLLE